MRPLTSCWPKQVFLIVSPILLVAACGRLAPDAKFRGSEKQEIDPATAKTGQESSDSDVSPAPPPPAEAPPSEGPKGEDTPPVDDKEDEKRKKQIEELTQKQDLTQVNATMVSNAGLLPSYLVQGDGRKIATRIAFHVDKGKIMRAYDQNGKTLWELDTKTKISSGWQVLPGIAGGFDFDVDGVPDLYFLSGIATGSCGVSTVQNRRIHFVSGKSGTVFNNIISPMGDLCFPEYNYATVQLSSISILWGPNASTMLFVPYYATQGNFLRAGTTPFAKKANDYLFYPSTPSYDYSYQYDVLNAHGTGTSYEVMSHAANGMVLKVGGQERVVFFTGGRIVQYDTRPFWSGQLISDRTYLSGGRTDILGRNYGLVVRDPHSLDNLYLVAGTSNLAVYRDRQENRRSSDPFGGIERHVSSYNLRNSALADRFFSFAHDPNLTDGHLYENRISFPSNPIVPVPNSKSRLAFNVFGAGEWNLHVTSPGGINTQKSMSKVLLWDIVNWGSGNKSIWLTSPTMVEPGVPGAGRYFPQYRTDIQVWDETKRELQIVTTINDFIPKLVPRFSGEERVSSQGSLIAPALVRDAIGNLSIVMIGRDGKEQLVPLPKI